MTTKPEPPMTVFLVNGTTINVPYDPEVMAFTNDGYEIRNPTQSECSRFYIDPKEYGFEVWNSGGGIMVLKRELPGNGGYLLLTTADGSSIPAPADSDTALLGRYTNGGDPVAYITVGNIPFVGEEEPIEILTVETMTVFVDGQPEQRAVDHIMRPESLIKGKWVPNRLSKRVPVLKEGEVIRETVDGKVHIFKQ
jgi:hypothetical protein